MKWYLFVLAVSGLLFSGCCTKKGCPSWELPFVTIHFTNAVAGDAVTVFHFADNALVDSTQHDASADLVLSPFTGYDGSTAAGKHFEIKRNGKTDIISEFSAEFFQEKIVCNKCFPFGKDRETIWKYSGFSYTHNSQRRSGFSMDLEY